MSNYEFYGDTERNSGSKYVILNISDEDNPHLLMNHEEKVIILHDEQNEDQLEEAIEAILTKYDCSHAIVIDF